MSSSAPTFDINIFLCEALQTPKTPQKPVVKEIRTTKTKQNEDFMKLTGCKKRQQVQQAAPQKLEVEIAGKKQTPLSELLFDLPPFKKQKVSTIKQPVNKLKWTPEEDEQLKSIMMESNGKKYSEICVGSSFT